MQHILDVMKEMNGVDDGGYKTMTVDEVVEMVENLLVERTEALLNPPPLPAICRYAATLERYREISKERARAVAEALVGVRVTR